MERRARAASEKQDRVEHATHEPSFSPSSSVDQQHPTLLQEGTKKNRKGRLVRAYEGFLAAPVPVVLAVMWIAGVALISVCGVALYLLLYLLWLSLFSP